VPAVVVRPATLHDVGALVDLLAAVTEEGRWLGAEAPIDREERARRFADDIGERGMQWVAVAGDEVVGHLGLDLAPYGVAHLSMLVAADRRRQGVGSALLEAAIAGARERGAHKVALQLWPHNEAARALYSKFGFAEEGLLRRHYRRADGELWDAVVMGLVLDDRTPAP
jgi:RimJ/RimL family protein N-acetyltransferase